MSGRILMCEPSEEIYNADRCYAFARLAVDKAKLCPVNREHSNPPPRVAIVVEKDGDLLGWAAKGVGGGFSLHGEWQSFCFEPQKHAEAALLEHLGFVDLSGATAYVTLEPCTRRKRGESCADLLIKSGIANIHIGNSDPNPDIGALAWQKFHSHGLAVKDFPADLRNEARRDNNDFFLKFRYSRKRSGSCAFDYTQNDGRRVLEHNGMQFETRWTTCGTGSIYALDYDNYVCLAKHCSNFNQIDDPGRWFEDSNYTKRVAEGEVVIFRNEHGYALVKILQVILQAESSNAELKFRYELRCR